jgi:hypothetical protein
LRHAPVRKIKPGHVDLYRSAEKIRGDAAIFRELSPVRRAPTLQWCAKLQKFVLMPPMQLTNDFPGGNIQRSKQGSGAVAHMIAGTALGNAGRQGQDRLRAIEP